jgi:predicted dinucleotide-binding enzyme
MKIAFIGAGQVGAALAVRLAEAGHEVVLAQSQEASSSVAAALQRSKRLVARPLRDAVLDAEVIVLATPFGANRSLLEPLSSLLAEKVLVDCTNPVGPGLSHALKSERSGSELIQSLVPAARVVKAFSIYGYENLENPRFAEYDVRPAMLFCGDDASAKRSVATLIEAAASSRSTSGAFSKRCTSST